ncbi:hypothetical protein CGRA01v4_06174 [Colletotrichum graminicola]|nr:hypothetical protein CGRA01v4_06174 [Colletotrichum graminicola]
MAPNFLDRTRSNNMEGNCEYSCERYPAQGGTVVWGASEEGPSPFFVLVSFSDFFLSNFQFCLLRVS